MKTDTPTITKLRQELRAAKEDAAYWEKAHERERAERQKEIGMQEYRGNTISYIYDKCKNYGAHFDRMNLEIADLKAKLAATPTTSAGEDGELLRKLVRVADIADLYMGPPCNNPMPVPDDRVVLEYQHGDDEVTITLGECRRFRAAKSNSPSAGAEGGKS